MTDAWVVGCAVMCCVGGLGLIGRLRVAARSGTRPQPVRAAGGGNPTDLLIADLERIARRVRGGDALTSAMVDIHWPRADGGSPSADLQVARHAVALAAGVGGQIAATLDAAAVTLRARQAVRAEVAAHSAQARLSIRVLTLVPLAMAAWTASTASGRAALASPAGLVCVVAGAAFNGRRVDVDARPDPIGVAMSAWLVAASTVVVVAGGLPVVLGRVMRAGRSVSARPSGGPAARAVRLSRRRRARLVEAAWPDAIDMLLLTIAAGFLPVQAIESVRGLLPAPLSDAFASVGRRCAAGERFADAVQSVSEELGPIASPLVDGLAMADRYGLPLGPVLARLGDEARHHRRRAAEARARQLPVRLAAPMVVCTLPSFVLLAIAPLLIGAFSSLRR